jgi:hypothetical protein
VNSGGAELKSLAEKGSFAVNEAGFQAYLKACDFFLDGYDKVHTDLSVLARGAQMGSSQYAKAVADFNVKVADATLSRCCRTSRSCRRAFNKHWKL